MLCGRRALKLFLAVHEGMRSTFVFQKGLEKAAGWTAFPSMPRGGQGVARKRREPERVRERGAQSVRAALGAAAAAAISRVGAARAMNHVRTSVGSCLLGFGSYEIQVNYEHYTFFIAFVSISEIDPGRHSTPHLQYFDVQYKIDASCLTWEGQQFQGKAAIVEKLSSLPFQKIQHSITAQDHQPTPDSCILSMVVGQLKADDDQILGFHQTFLLKSLQCAWVCTNDVFRLALHNV
uniref:Uncharacterized protein n=1 Tax=Sphaerodactylus townsendi TaxID=933632 RepID=A0ACB8EAI7_9SAUR